MEKVNLENRRKLLGVQYEGIYSLIDRASNL